MRQEVRREKIVRQPLGELAERVRGGRSDEEQIARLGELDVIDRRRVARAPDFRQHFVLREHGEGQRRDELPRAAGHGHAHVRPAGREAPEHFDGFVGGDAPADAEKDARGPGHGTETVGRLV